MIALEVDDTQKAADYLKTKGIGIVGAESSRDVLTSGHLRPERLPHRAQAVVYMSRSEFNP
jgi:hypothetical protein